MSNFYAESVFDAREVVNHPYVEYKEEQYLPPQTDTSSLSNINVECRGSMDTYLDIANAYAKVEWKVTNGDGSNTDANTAASLPVPAQLFKRVSVALSGAEIDHCDDCGPIQAQLEKWESSGDQIVNANNLQAMRDLCEDHLVMRVLRMPSITAFTLPINSVLLKRLSFHFPLSLVS